MSGLTTWADSYGLWHAKVPAQPDPARAARKAIRAELKARGEIGAGYRLKVNSVARHGDVVEFVESPSPSQSLTRYVAKQVTR